MNDSENEVLKTPKTFKPNPNYNEFLLEYFKKKSKKCLYQSARTSKP